MRVSRAIACASRGRSQGDWYSSEHRQMIEFNSDKYSNSITSVQKDCMVALVYESS